MCKVLYKLLLISSEALRDTDFFSSWDPFLSHFRMPCLFDLSLWILQLILLIGGQLFDYRGLRRGYVFGGYHCLYLCYFCSLYWLSFCWLCGLALYKIDRGLILMENIAVVFPGWWCLSGFLSSLKAQAVWRFPLNMPLSCIHFFRSREAVNSTD